MTLKEWDKNKAAVINIEAVFGSRSSGTWNPHVQLAHGTRKPLSLHAGQLVLDQHGSRFVVNLPERCCACRLSPPRRQSIYSGLAAAAAALDLGLPDSAIAWALGHASPIPGCLEPIENGQAFGVYVDSANRPAPLRRSLEALRRVTPGRLLLLIGQPSHHGRDVRMAVGRTASILADITVVTNDNPGQDIPIQIAADIVSGAIPSGGRFDIVLDRAQAIRRLVNLANPGDSLLIAGKGHHTRQEQASTIRPFDDRIFARQALSKSFDSQVR